MMDEVTFKFIFFQKKIMENKICIVTGASRGMGRGIALVLAKEEDLVLPGEGDFVLADEGTWEYLGGTQEAPRRPLVGLWRQPGGLQRYSGGIWRHPGGIQEASRRHLEGIWWHLGAPWDHPEAPWDPDPKKHQKYHFLGPHVDVGF